MAVQCTTNAYSVGGALSGLSGAGLVHADNLGNDLAIGPGQSAFAFPTGLASGATYGVTVLNQPVSPSQTCTVNNGSGPVSNAAVSSVSLSCTTNTYPVGVTIVGPAGGRFGPSAQRRQ